MLRLRRFIVMSLLGMCVLGAAVTLGACGNSTGENAASAHPLTKSELVSEIEAICRKGNRERLQGLGEAAKRGEGVFESTPEGIEELAADVVLPAFQDTISELNELQPAAGQGKVLAEIAGDYETAMKEAEVDPGKLVSDNPFRAGDKVAKENGIKGCRLGA